MVLVVLLIASAGAILLRRARPPPLGPARPAASCALPVERAGEGIQCMDENSMRAGTLSPGDRLLPDGTRARMAPARLELFAVPLDPNRAPVEELASLPGIGPALAARIAAARPFASVDDVARVEGIGRRRLRALRPRLRIEAPVAIAR